MDLESPKSATLRSRGSGRSPRNASDGTYALEDGSHITTALESQTETPPGRATRVDVGEWITTRERVRSRRLQRHLAIAGIASLWLFHLFATYDSLLDAALIPIAMAVFLQSIARGVSARFGYLWGWPYPEPVASTRLDLWVAGVASRLSSAPRSDSSERADERVRILENWEDD